MSTTAAPEAPRYSRFDRIVRIPLAGWTVWFLFIPQILLSVFTWVSIALTPIGIGILMFAPVSAATRKLADAARRRSERWGGPHIPVPYRQAPEFSRGLVGVVQRVQWLRTDPATWRDVTWLAIDPIVGATLAFLPAMMILYGIWGIVLLFVWQVIHDHGGNEWYLGIPQVNWFTAICAAVLGCALIFSGVRVGPWVRPRYGRWQARLLAPTRGAQLAGRVQHLTEARSEALDTSAAELRRIERDLHDGAQARLVAMGMNLGAAEHLLDSDPAAARRLLAETREASALALNELRDLVRGIHPPVLADRGLGDAVKALALESALDVSVTVDLPGRLEPPLESAGYFAVSEMLANAGKHARAGHVWVDIRAVGDTLRMTVTDDGRGGATLDGGTGLRGIERRLGTFDGTLRLSSPQGGPTTVTMELPCVLSSPKTSPS